jgi:hypothetical protein
MNLYLLERKDDGGYDTYDSCVVVAENEENARLIHPCNNDYKWYNNEWVRDNWIDRTWTDPVELIVKELGIANSDVSGVICASFNAG